MMVATFLSHTSGVWTLQFNPFDRFKFAGGFSDGVIQVWDTRINKKPLQHISQAHAGHVYALDWHPQHQHIVASAGFKDHRLRVWSLSLAASSSSSASKEQRLSDATAPAVRLISVSIVSLSLVKRQIKALAAGVLGWSLHSYLIFRSSPWSDVFNTFASLELLCWWSLL
jgi:WD40 repeat protein